MTNSRISVTIHGLSPLICNKFTDASMLADGTTPSMKGQKPIPREQAEAKIYGSATGPVIPGPNIFRCLIDAGRFTKVGKSQITTAKSSLLPAGCLVTNLECPILTLAGLAAPWEVDSRSVVIPATGGRVMAHRPRFDEWTISFDLDLDLKMFDPKTIRGVVDDAGTKIGLGDFRPARKGPFGRFKVTKWKAE